MRARKTKTILKETNNTGVQTEATWNLPVSRHTRRQVRVSLSGGTRNHACGEEPDGPKTARRTYPLDRAQAYADTRYDARRW
jgi:hypothetical protein